MRDWGRDCWCKPGCDNTCGKRFAWKFPNLPQGYDHKYVYSNVGYNLKATDMQAAVGLAQLEKLEGFIEARRENFEFYLKLFGKHGRFFMLPSLLEGAKPSPFGFLVNLREGAPFSRLEMVSHLEKAGIATRMLFGGNMARQPAYEGENFRVAGELKNSDHVMNSAFWIGVWPGITGQMREYVAGKVDEFLSAY
jgi:CDP-6-deoxy-D-xylo-4-hexulose-3-dehydrase